jgi:hypothetical protein
MTTPNELVNMKFPCVKNGESMPKIEFPVKLLVQSLPAFSLLLAALAQNFLVP